MYLQTTKQNMGILNKFNSFMGISVLIKQKFYINYSDFAQIV